MSNLDREAVNAFRNDTEQDAAISGLPPGYIEGFRPVLQQNLTVAIGGGITSVQGQRIDKSATILTRQMWNSPYTGGDSGFFYYVYLTRDGDYKVDFTRPVYSDTEFYFAHPAFGWRVILRLWVDSDDKIKFVSKEFNDTPRIVTVAPAGYIGEADYYCNGVNDEIWVNAAIEYAEEVKLLSGDYYFTDDVSMQSDTIVSGQGNKTVLYSGGELLFFRFHGTPSTTLSRMQIKDFTIVGQGATTGVVSINYANNISIERMNIYYEQTAGSAESLPVLLRMVGTSDVPVAFVSVTGCSLFSGTTLATNTSNVIFSGNTFDYVSVGLGSASSPVEQTTFSNNQIKTSGNYSSRSDVTISGSNSTITGNSFGKFTALSAGGSGLAISNNSFESARNTPISIFPVSSQDGGVTADSFTILGNDIVSTILAKQHVPTSATPPYITGDSAPSVSGWAHDTGVALPGTVYTDAWKNDGTASVVPLSNDTAGAFTSPEELGGLPESGVAYLVVDIYVDSGATPANISVRFQGYNGSTWSTLASGSPSSTGAWESVQVECERDSGYSEYRYNISGLEEYWVGGAYLKVGYPTNYIWSDGQYNRIYTCFGISDSIGSGGTRSIANNSWQFLDSDPDFLAVIDGGDSSTTF